MVDNTEAMLALMEDLLKDYYIKKGRFPEVDRKRLRAVAEYLVNEDKNFTQEEIDLLIGYEGYPSQDEDEDEE